MPSYKNLLLRDLLPCNAALQGIGQPQTQPGGDESLRCAGGLVVGHCITAPPNFPDRVLFQANIPPTSGPTITRLYIQKLHVYVYIYVFIKNTYTCIRIQMYVQGCVEKPIYVHICTNK